MVPLSSKRKARLVSSTNNDEDVVKRYKNKKKVVVVEEIDSEYDVEQDVQDISPIKKSASKKISIRIPDAPLDNISFHSVGNAEKWKYVFQRRITLERELGVGALECKEIVELIPFAGFMKIVTRFAKCYETLVKEFIVNIPIDCADHKIKEYRKVFVRGSVCSEIL